MALPNSKATFDLFILHLPPINLHTANLLWPYHNGVEFARMQGIVQPRDLMLSDEILPEANNLVAQRNGVSHASSN